MKKLICFTLALVLMLTLVACGSAQNQTPAALDGGQPTESAPSESTTNEATEPEVTEPEVTEPEVTEPEVTEPEGTEPEVTEPEVTEPEVTEPEVTEPEVTKPEGTNPEDTKPEGTKPEGTKPEVTDPKPAEPQKPVVKNEFFNATNYEMVEGQISVKPRHAYWKDGELVVECFVINGESYIVRNVEVSRLVVETPDGEVIADAYFANCHEEDVRYGNWYTHTFVFSREQVLMENANLQTLVVKSTQSWNGIVNEYFNSNDYFYHMGSGSLIQEDPAVAEKKLDVRVRWAYWDNGALKVRLIVANGLDTVATNINVTNLTFTNANGVIATGVVGVLQMEDHTNLSVEPGQYADLEITITDGVLAPDAELISADWSILFGYSR